MNARHEALLAMAEAGPVRIAEAASALGVTEMTIRRDIRALEKRGLALAVKGGAIRHPGPLAGLGGADDRRALKNALAETLWQRLEGADSLFLSTGTTVLALARLIARRQRRPLTVITNALPVASALFGTTCKIVLLGGELRDRSLDLVGPVAEKNLAEYHVDWLVSGCDGASADAGFYTSDINLSNLERQSIAIADRVAVVAESAKFGGKSLVRFAAPEEVRLLVTDAGLSDADAATLAARGTEVARVALPQSAL